MNMYETREICKNWFAWWQLVKGKVLSIHISFTLQYNTYYLQLKTNIVKNNTILLHNYMQSYV